MTNPGKDEIVEGGHYEGWNPFDRPTSEEILEQAIANLERDLAPLRKYIAARARERAARLTTLRTTEPCDGLREAAKNLLALVERNSEGQCGPFAIRNTIYNSAEFAALAQATEPRHG